MQSNAQGPQQADVVTFLYVPSASWTIRRFHVRRSWIRRGMACAILALAAALVLCVDYIRVRRDVVELDGLRAETREQRDQLMDYADKMEFISHQLAAVGRLDRKLRVITNLDPSDPLPLPGIGGVEGELLEAHQLTGLTRERRHQRMMEGLGRLSEAASSEEKSLVGLIEHLENQTAQLVRTPSISPTKGWVTSAFGYRTSPFTGNREFHRGVDIAGRKGTPIIAPADATVRFVGQRRHLGNTIILRHGYGVETVYGHLSELAVERGRKVKRGQTIALMGTTGRSTGPHLHYQVQVNGVPVNPRNYILD